MAVRNMGFQRVLAGARASSALNPTNRAKCPVHWMQAESLPHKERRFVTAHPGGRDCIPAHFSAGGGGAEAKSPHTMQARCLHDSAQAESLCYAGRLKACITRLRQNA